MPPESAPSDKKVRLGRTAAYGALAVVLGVTAVFFVERHPSRQAAAPPLAGSSGAQRGATEQPDPIRALLQPLLENPDWSNPRVLALNEALVEAGQAQIDAARNTDWFQAFVESVRSRLRQQQALAGAPLTPNSSPLAALAVTLGIDLAAPNQPVQAAAGGAERNIAHAESPARPRKTEAHEAQGAAASATPARAKLASSPAAAPASGPASTSPASAAQSRAHAAGPVTAQQGSSGAAGAASASVATTSPNQSSTTPAHREHPACSAALSRVRLNYCQDFLASGDAAPLLAVIPGGSFMMGSGESPAEGPVHRVTLSHVFAMSVYEVSQSEFQLYCRAAGKECPQQPWSRGDDPVVNVSWEDASDYAQWLSQATHQRYRLPTEAEWEYAARAGQTGLYPSGNTLSPTDAYFSIGATLTAPAPRSMRFNANGWHLMHMIGNAREWVQDAWSPTFDGAPADGSARQEGKPGIKVVRGGCYADPAIRLRLSTREALAADTRDACTGIRLVREIR